MIWKFDRAYLSRRWYEPAYVQIDSTGKIIKVTEDLEDSHIDHFVSGVFIPGISNSHSHAFQYAMAGLSESIIVGKEFDDFWSWREQMYKLALNLEPDDIELIATYLYMTMLERGYSHVLEFHYLHKDKNGKPYPDPIEISKRLFNAAKKVGMPMTLVPVYYNTSNFNCAAKEEQKRFLFSNTKEYLDFLISIEKYGQIGHGIHSLRAAPLENIIEILSSSFNRPAHIHISEQLKEVNDAVKFCGKRPVKWILDEIKNHENLNLVHATHLDSDELNQLSNSKSRVVLCPSTEGNLGDGFFPIKEFFQLGGSFSIGSDSHIGLDPFEEIRWLDYQARLKSQKRNILCIDKQSESGSLLFDHVLQSGKESCGVSGNYLRGFVLDSGHPFVKSTPNKKLISSLVYTLSRESWKGVIIDGEWKVKNGKHILADEINPLACGLLSKLRQN